MEGINFYVNRYRRGFNAITYIKYFSNPFILNNNKTLGRLEFNRPTLDSVKIYNPNKIGNGYNFTIFAEDLNPGRYTDFEIENESLFLYYR